MVGLWTLDSGLWTKTEARVLLTLLVLEVVGLFVIVGREHVAVGFLLVILSAIGQSSVALRLRARRRRAGTWRSNRA